MKEWSTEEMCALRKQLGLIDFDRPITKGFWRMVSRNVRTKTIEECRLIGTRILKIDGRLKKGGKTQKRSQIHGDLYCHLCKQTDCEYVRYVSYKDAFFSYPFEGMTLKDKYVLLHAVASISRTKHRTIGKIDFLNEYYSYQNSHLKKFSGQFWQFTYRHISSIQKDGPNISIDHTWKKRQFQRVKESQTNDRNCTPQAKIKSLDRRSYSDKSLHDIRKAELITPHKSDIGKYFVDSPNQHISISRSYSIYYSDSSDSCIDGIDKSTDTAPMAKKRSPSTDKILDSDTVLFDSFRNEEIEILCKLEGQPGNRTLLIDPKTPLYLIIEILRDIGYLTPEEANYQMFDALHSILDPHSTVEQNQIKVLIIRDLSGRSYLKRRRGYDMSEWRRIRVSSKMQRQMV